MKHYKVPNVDRPLRLSEEHAESIGAVEVPPGDVEQMERDAAVAAAEQVKAANEARRQAAEEARAAAVEQAQADAAAAEKALAEAAAQQDTTDGSGGEDEQPQPSPEDQVSGSSSGESVADQR